MKLKNICKLFIFSFLMLFVSGNSLAQQAKVTVNQDEKIPDLLQLKKSLEQENKLTDGYTIQLYYGELKEANTVIRKYRNLYSAWPASIEYETPNYKVWVGNYNSRLDADRAMIEIRNKFPNAFILKPSRNNP
jgi:hypothetical protein